MSGIKERGKAAEEAWAHKENQKAIDNLKKKDAEKNKGKGGDGKNAAPSKDAPKKPAKK